jgi:hypothetical protein
MTSSSHYDKSVAPCWGPIKSELERMIADDRLTDLAYDKED